MLINLTFFFSKSMSPVITLDCLSLSLINFIFIFDIFTFDDKTNEDDITFGKAVIDKSSLDIITGSIVDFKKEMIGESFVINNPKATSSCGCGLSFSV